MTPRKLPRHHLHLDAATWCRAGSGLIIHQSAHLLAWVYTDTPSEAWALLRPPTAPPWNTGSPPVPTRTGPAAQLGRHVYLGAALHPFDHRRPAALGHTAAARRGLTLHTVSEVCLPESARERGARPWPHTPGWAWADHDTLYRQAPSGLITVAAHLPARISTFDVGPRGAVWFVASGVLFGAAPGRWARPLRFDDSPVSELTPGDLIFQDDGKHVILADHNQARPTCLRTGRRGDPAPPTIGLSPPTHWSTGRSVLDTTTADACAHGSTTHIARTDGDTLSIFSATGQRKLPLPAPGIDVRVTRQQVVVLTASGLHATTLDGEPAVPSPQALLAPTPETGTSEAGAWARSGAVLATPQ